MNGWMRSDTIEGNGYFWTNDDETLSAFEDTSEGYSQFYAWKGSHDRHDHAEQTAVFPTLAEAVAALTPHLTHLVKATYDAQGVASRHCLTCDVPVPPVMRTCPRCTAEFDGTSIGATMAARILCAECSAKQGSGDCR